VARGEGAAPDLGADALVEAEDAIPADDRMQRAAPLAAAVGMEHGILREQARQRVDVAGGHGLDEGVRERARLAVARRVARPILADVRARPRRQLAAGALAVIERRGHGRVVHVEDVVEQERRALERRKAFQREQERDRQVLGQGLAGLGDDGLRQPRADVLLAALPRGFHPIEAEPRDHARQVRARLHDRRAIDVAPAQERVLDDVLGLGDGAEHAIGQPGEEASVAFEVRHAAPRVVAHAASVASCAGETARPATTTRVHAWPWPSAYLSVG
jgi:hypothetical protein